MINIGLDPKITLEPISGTGAWYQATDYVHGDLYEAEELYQDGHSIDCNSLYFIHFPDGTIYEPAPKKKGRYFGNTAYVDGNLAFLMVDFPEDRISVMEFDTVSGETQVLAELSRKDVKDCYNLMVHGSPLFLTRQANDGKFQIIWPWKAEFPIERTETFDFRDGDKLYFAAWYEDPDYREDVIVRSLDGELMDRYPGTIYTMPNGERWKIGYTD